ncbi:MAG: carboxypeptidase regulatory-like domain-containing protein [Candidatus Latescibacteria bacterium]|jgi:hypothetical protein|nr:carboxypeptidase regulatory-like domain-containing protein [Candidatus Latescibacterota bacterium]
MNKHYSIPVFVVLLAVTIFLSCDKDKEKSIIGPVEDTFTISGRVLQENGYAFFGNRVVTIIGTGVEESTMTDSMGVYSFEGLSAGEYTITPTNLSGGLIFFPSSMEVSITGSNVDIDNFYGWIVGESIIVGKILDIDANPVCQVHVTIIPQQFDPKSVGSGSTNSYGFYWASGSIFRNESYLVVPDKSGYNYTFSPDTSYVTPTEQFTEVNFIATYSGEPLHSISGRIVDTDGNGVFLPIIYLNAENAVESRRHISTDKNGFYSSHGLKDGNYILFSYDEIGIAREYIIVDGEDVIMPDLVLSYRGPTNYVFSGSVLDNSGNGIHGVKVLIPIVGVGYLETNEEGYYSMSETNYHISVNEYKVSKSIFFFPSKSGFSFTPDTTWVTIEWQKGLEFAELTVPDIIGFDWGAFKAGDYFPLGTGTSWTYERTTDGGEPYEHSVSVSGIETVNGLTYTLMSSGYSDYFSAFRIENNTVYTHTENEDKEYLKFGVERGSKWAITSIRGKVLSATFVDIETVSVPAGTFEVCLHFELNLPLGDISYEKTDLWYARDIGLVRAEKFVVSMGEVMETVTDELKDYNVE